MAGSLQILSLELVPYLKSQFGTSDFVIKLANAVAAAINNTVVLIGDAAVNGASGVTVTDNGDGSVTVSADGPNITGLNASNVASGTLADGRLSSNIPLKNAANAFTAVPQSVATTALGDTTTPVSAATLKNTTAATGGVPVQDSPALVLEGRGWGKGVPADAAADRPYRVAFNLRPNPASSVIPNAEVAFQRDGGSWVSALVFGGPDEYSSIQQSTLYGALGVYGAVEAINSPFSLRNSSNATSTALQKKAGTDDTEVRSLVAAGKVHVLDSTAAYTNLISKNTTYHVIETGTSKTMVSRERYQNTNAALCTFTLPATAAVGERMEIVGVGTGLWTIAQNASQIIHFGATSTTTGVGGSVSANHRRDCITLECVTANLEWNVVSSVGANFTVV